ncbi:uncharacterized protein ACOB8E_014865 isoform 1-T1 [Sarcophilus harrisii]
MYDPVCQRGRRKLTLWERNHLRRFHPEERIRMRKPRVRRKTQKESPPANECFISPPTSPTGETGIDNLSHSINKHLLRGYKAFEMEMIAIFVFISLTREVARGKGCKKASLF